MMSNDDFLNAFERCTLPGSAWTHEAHIRMAWLYLMRYDESTALLHIRTGILRYNANVTKKAGAYHETITVAYTRLVADRLTALPRDHRFDDFKVISNDLLDRTMTALLVYYSRERLFSDTARAQFIPPDLKPLPLHPEKALEWLPGQQKRSA